MITARQVTGFACAVSCSLHMIAAAVLMKPIESIHEMDLFPVELLMAQQEARQTVASEPMQRIPHRTGSAASAAPLISRHQSAVVKDEPSAGASFATGSALSLDRTVSAQAAHSPATPSAEATVNRRGEYLSAVRARIERNREYPSHARQVRLEGVVIVSMRIIADGRIEAVRIVSTSGHQFLDKAAERAVRAAAPFAAPASYGLRDGVMVEVPIVYRLKEK